MQSEINIQIGSKAPSLYCNELKEQCCVGPLKYGGICDLGELSENFEMNCVPGELGEMEIDNYEEFLNQRRKLMADKIKNYYFSL